MIIQSAVRTSDGYLFVGTRHDECYKAISKANLREKAHIGSEDGFVTTDCVFLNREDALVYAREHGQVKDLIGGGLTSEDLWWPKNYPND